MPASRDGSYWANTTTIISLGGAPPAPVQGYTGIDVSSPDRQCAVQGWGDQGSLEGTDFGSLLYLDGKQHWQLVVWAGEQKACTQFDIGEKGSFCPAACVGCCEAS